MLKILFKVLLVYNFILNVNYAANVLNDENLTEIDLAEKDLNARVPLKSINPLEDDFSSSDSSSPTPPTKHTISPHQPHSHAPKPIPITYMHSPFCPPPSPHDPT